MSNQLTFYGETAEGFGALSHGRPLDEHERRRMLAGMVLN